MEFENTRYGITKDWGRDLIHALQTNFNVQLQYTGVKEDLCKYKNTWFTITDNGGEINVNIVNFGLIDSIPYAGSHPTPWKEDPLDMAVKIMDAVKIGREATLHCKSLYETVTPSEESIKRANEATKRLLSAEKAGELDEFLDQTRSYEAD